jgi:hypothetical protein
MMWNRDERPTLKDLLEGLLVLEQDCAEKMASAGKRWVHWYMSSKYRRKRRKRNDTKGTTTLIRALPTAVATAMERVILSLYTHPVSVYERMCEALFAAARTDIFVVTACFREHVNEQLGAPTIVCRETNCDAVYSAKQVHDHVEEKLLYNHISEAKRLSFLEDLWGRGALRGLHVVRTKHSLL